MANENFDKIVVLLADAKAEMRRLVHDAFRNFGLRGVRDYSSVMALQASIASNVQPDLIVTDARFPDGEVFGLVERMRRGDLGNNPFVPVILMTWNADADLIKKAVDCGVDYILAAPISPQDVFKRIQILIADRKPFVVTSDYIGPDRRRDPSRGDSDIPLIDVPNTLRSRALGEIVDLDALDAMVQETMAEVNEQRLIRHSYQINLLVGMILPAYASGKVTPEIQVHVQKLAAVAEEVRDRLIGSRFEHVGELCQNLSDVADSIHSNWEKPSRKDIDLLTPLSQAVLASFNPKRDSSEMAGEIAGMVSKFSGKINEEARRQLAEA